MNNESGDDSVNKSEPGRKDDGQTTGTTAILGLPPATNFSLHSLPGHESVELPEQSYELEEELQDELERTERTVAPPWGGCDSKCGVAAGPGVVPELWAFPWGG